MELRKGDYGYDITFTAKKEDGTIYDLSSITGIKLLVRRANDAINILEGTCTVIVAANGTCKYTVQSGDFDEIGNFIAGLRMTTATSRISSKEINITVSEPYKY